MVEGYTGNVKFMGNGVINDNWDLNALGATSIVRLLQYDCGIRPSIMVSAGLSEYIPVGNNLNEEERSLNRRTRIVIFPNWISSLNYWKIKMSRLGTAGQQNGENIFDPITRYVRRTADKLIVLRHKVVSRSCILNLL